MRKVTRVGGLICLSLLLAACPRPVRPPPPTPTVPPTPSAPLRRHARRCGVRGQPAELAAQHPGVSRRQVFPPRPQSRDDLAAGLSGRVWVHPEFARSGFELSFPVAQLVVDDAQARRAAGSDFPPDIPQSDKDGTRKNMLRAGSARWRALPEVKLRSAHVAGTLEAPQVTAHITIKDASRDVQVPVKIVIEGAKLTRERRVRHPADGVRHQAVQRRARRARGAGQAAHRVQDRGGEALGAGRWSGAELISFASASAPYTSRSAARMMAGCTATVRFMVSSYQ